MENKELKAVISKKFSKSAWILLACWTGVVAFITIIGITLFNHQYQYGTYEDGTYLYWFSIWYGKKTAGKISLYQDFYFIFFITLLIYTIVPLIYVLINRRKRKLTELTATEKEIIGSYSGFIPISKITLKMPIEKIDNIAAVKSFFFLYTGKALRVASTAGAFKIPYVDNADEIVAFISEAIEKAKNRPVQAAVAQPVIPQTDATDSLKKLAELRDSGIITEEEFNQKKSELLGKM